MKFCVIDNVAKQRLVYETLEAAERAYAEVAYQYRDHDQLADIRLETEE